jgi:hypothetical protein
MDPHPLKQERVPLDKTGALSMVPVLSAPFSRN